MAEADRAFSWIRVLLVISTYWRAYAKEKRASHSVNLSGTLCLIIAYDNYTATHQALLTLPIYIHWYLLGR